LKVDSVKMTFQDNLKMMALGIRQDYDFGSLCGFKTRGIVRYFAETDNVNRLQRLLAFADSNNIEVVACGNGTNILIHEYYDGIFIRWTGRSINKVSLDKDVVFLKVEAGVSKIDLLDYCVRNSLSGIEFWSGIPGLFGGGVAMNAGAHDMQISDYLTTLEVATPEGIKTLDVSSLDHSYRKMGLPEHAILISGVLRLKKSDNKGEILQKNKAYIEERQKKHPLYFPSCGSVFKNPPDRKKGAWQYIKESGLHDLAFNDAKVSLLHSNFIVNVGEASSEDVLSLIMYIRQKVRNSFNVELEPEIRVYGSGRLSRR
jgi:UDP-N-acetylmuramate dehydrogenase